MVRFQMHLMVFVTAVWAVGVPPTTASAQFTDNFDYANNTALEAVWGAPVVGGATGSSFTYNTGVGTLNATQLADADVGGYATAIFSRPISYSGDFLATMEFDWNQSAVLGTMFLELEGASGVIASGGLGDDTGLPGHAYMQVGGGSTYLGPDGTYIGGATSFETQTGAIATSFDNASIVSGAADEVRSGNAIGDVGAAVLTIRRLADELSLSIDDGTNVFSLGPIAGSAEDITSVNLIFAGFEYGASPNVLVGDTGTHIAVDSVSLSELGTPGDANLDGSVDLADYQLIQANAFTEVAPGSMLGDVNFDLFVDFTDFQIWKENFPGGVGAAELAIASLVPEPSTVLILGLALVTMVVTPHRWRKNNC